MCKRKGVLMKLLFILLLLWCLRLLINISRLYHSYKLRALYRQYAKRENNKAMQHRDEIISLFNYANIEEDVMYESTIRGGRVINTTPYPIYSNMFNDTADIENSVLMYFEYAIGTFKRRIKENFRPVFWIECILYLPQKVLKYLHKDISHSASNFISFLYWIIGLLVTIYTLELKGILNDLIEYLSSLI